MFLAPLQKLTAFEVSGLPLLPIMWKGNHSGDIVDKQSNPQKRINKGRNIAIQDW